jgi:hypothetical protein
MAREWAEWLSQHPTYSRQEKSKSLQFHLANLAKVVPIRRMAWLELRRFWRKLSVFGGWLGWNHSEVGNGAVAAKIAKRQIQSS